MNREESIQELEAENLESKREAKNVFAIHIIRGVLTSGEDIDKLVTWVLIGTGATVSLLASNIADIVPMLMPGGFRRMLLWMTFSASLGLAARGAGVWAQAVTKALDQLEKTIPGFVNRRLQAEQDLEKRARVLGFEIDTQMDLKRAVSEATKYVPRPMRWLIEWQCRKTNNQAQDAYNVPVQMHSLQSICAVAQFLLFFVGLIDLARSLRVLGAE